MSEKSAIEEEKNKNEENKEAKNNEGKSKQTNSPIINLLTKRKSPRQLKLPIQAINQRLHENITFVNRLFVSGFKTNKKKISRG